MKKTMSLLLMGFMGMVGTYAWAGSAREDSVAACNRPSMFCTLLWRPQTKASRKKC